MKSEVAKHLHTELKTIHSQLQKIPANASLQEKCFQLLIEHWGQFETSNDIIVYEVLTVLFEDNIIKHQRIAPLAIRQLKRKFAVSELSVTLIDDSLVESLTIDTLFLFILRKTYNTDTVFESLIRKLRQNFLLTYKTNTTIAETQLPILIAVAEQCFNNEFIINETEEERVLVQQIEIELNNTIDNSTIHTHQIALLIWGMYHPMTQLSCKDKVAEIPLNNFIPIIRPTIIKMLYEPLEEKRLAQEIPSFGAITCTTSQAVRGQYEVNPYPRWFHLGVPKQPLKVALKKINSKFSWPKSFPQDKLRILVPGCGTGHHPLLLARANPNADILALDLSRQSLAYGKRMAKKLHIHNVTFLHGDILELPKLNKKFHHIDCVGVLHHMKDPLAGWYALNKLLLHGGTLHIGVYSEVARMQIHLMRNEISKLKLNPSFYNIKHFRYQLLTQKRNANLLKRLSKMDFYSLSHFRDLLFHVSEYCYKLPEIKEIIQQFNFDFLGFRIPPLKKKYSELFPGDPHMNSFDNWCKFEKWYAGNCQLFNFWLSKKE